ncbi:peptidase M20 [Pacificimonas flava]|uniref:Peptidase M20 n=2 Tax=Pacificimonas TaxID=1960290 RepID=A0A219B3H2_9SPHN|nr:MULTISPECIES: amidohydrolase [Pacificimonas]MBZ6377423.1 amidohydrolase [Pacificimonas aurantium]OWV32875.1 peptidase M20 [Pacificimonas flava]
MRFAIFAALLGSAIPAPVFADEVSDYVTGEADELVSLYKHLHQNPELSGQEVETAARMAAELRDAGFDVTEGVGGTGVVGVIENGTGPVVMLRADMDGLPVTEETDLPYASTKTVTLENGSPAGVMHACGHDVHMTSWVGAARYLAANRDEWSGTLVMIAQPAEETGHGARAMLNDGLYERFPRPDHAVALHDSASMPAGTLGMASGYAMANVDSVDIIVKGSGGHGAYPHTTKDPIVLASRIVGALQTLVSRETDPQEAAVVTVGAFNAGTKHNIIPDTAHLQLTVRSYTDERREALLSGIQRVARGEAISAGIEEENWPEVTWDEIYTPALFNTEEQTSVLMSTFADRFGEDRVVALDPVMGGEDFARYHRADRDVESTLFWLGAVDRDVYEAAGGDGTGLPSLHSAKFAPDPLPTLTMGTEAMIGAALRLFAAD